MQVKDKNRNRRSIGAIALICLFLHHAIGPIIGLGAGHANFCLVFAGVIALTIGGSTGVLCGFVAGLVYDLSVTSPIGLMSLLLSLASFGMGFEVRDRIADDRLGSLVPFGIATFAVELIYHLCMLFTGQSSSLLDVIVFRTLPSTILTILAFVPFALVLGRAHGGNGPSYAGAKKLGSHYSLPRS